MTTNIQDEAIKQLTELALHIIEGIGKSALNAIGQETSKIRNAFYGASDDFIQRYETRHCKIKVLGMRESVDLSDIYTNVSIIEDVHAARYSSIDALEKELLQTGNRNLNPKAKASKPGIQVANEGKYLLVLGAPGSGKSTYLRKIGLEALKAKKVKSDNTTDYIHKNIPVYVELKKFMTETSSIEELIVQEFSIARFPEPELFMKSALDKGKLLILLDGLDEIPTLKFSQASDKIEDFVDKYNNNRFILSCRHAAYKGGFRKFKNIEMAAFDEKQIREFIFKWFNSELDKSTSTAKRCWKTLNLPEYQATKELAQTPLLLTLLCLVYHHDQDFPRNRTILYREAFNVLLKEWAAEKRIQRDPIYKDLTLPLEEMMLSEIAFYKFEQNKLFFSEDSLLKYISKFMSDNLNAPKHLDAPQILEAIALQQGIFVERARGIYSFSHLTFQEYLTAKYVDDNNIVDEIINKHLLEAKWREVILLIAGLMRKGSDLLVVQINIAAREIAKSNSNLVALFQWAQIVESHSEKPNVVNRILSIYLAVAFNIGKYRDNKWLYGKLLWVLREFDEDLGWVIGDAYLEDNEFGRELNRKLAREAFLYIQKRKVTIDIRKMIDVIDASPLKLTDTFNSTFEYPSLKWSEEDYEALLQYVDALLFLFQCKNASLKISKDTWTNITDKLITVD